MPEQISVNPTARAVSLQCRTFGLSWPLLAALFVLVGILYDKRINLGVLSDADTYWHLAAGRWIIEHGMVPTTDPFSHSMLQAPWTAHEWLAEVILALVHQMAGWGGLVFLTAALAAFTMACLLRFLLARMEPVHALMLTVVAATMMLSHLAARPHVLMWPLLAVWVGTLTNAGEKGDGPPWLLLPLMTLWANLHGSFVFGLALAGALALDAVLQSPGTLRRAAAIRWGAFVTLAILGAIVTPWGLHGLLFPFELTSMSVSLSVIQEWRSPNFQKFHPLELWLMIVLALACAGRVRLPWLRLLLVLGLVHLALQHNRHASVLGLVSPFLIASPLGACLRACRGQGGNVESLDRIFAALAAPARPVALAAVAAVGLLLGAEVARSDRNNPVAARTPEAAVQAAFAAGASGPVFNAYGFGGYLIHEGVPVFIDGRADMYGDALLQRYLGAMFLTGSEVLPKLLEEYRIGWTLIEPGTPALALLDRLPGWRRVYADAVAVVHVRDGGAPSSTRH
ncbi:hypothetical protein AZOA_27380 [Azoarcus sp. Aa7]|nr:hypothetical protein [Azoarcus sp. Aa7]